MFSKPYKKLYDIPSLPDSISKLKFQPITPDVYYDPDTLENFRKETLRFTGADKPIFEHELPRTQNPHRDLLLNINAFGTPYKKDPYHPELFLGEMSRDPRGVENDPIVSKVVDQARFRQERYIRGKLQDDPDVRAQGVASSKLLDRAVYGGFGLTATRMANIFDDSVDAAVRKSNPNPGNTIHKVGTSLKEEKGIYKIKEETIVPVNGYNPISFLSNQVGQKWQSQPDMKYGISSISNLYRSKQAVDQSANAAFRMSIQDEKFNESKSAFTQSVKHQLKQNIKNNKINQMNSKVDLKNDSRLNNFINRISNPSRMPGGSAANNANFTHKKEIDKINKINTYKAYNGRNKVNLGLREPLKIINQIYGNHGGMKIPKKDKMKILKSIRYDSKNNLIGTEGFSKRYSMNSKNLSKALTKRMEQYREVGGRNNAQVKEENSTYKQSKLYKPDDRITKIKRTKNKFNVVSEKITNPVGKGQTKPITTPNVGNFEFDTDPASDNLYMTQRNSARGSGYIFTERIYDNDIPPLSEIVNTRRYIATDKPDTYSIEVQNSLDSINSNELSKFKDITFEDKKNDRFRSKKSNMISTSLGSSELFKA